MMKKIFNNHNFYIIIIVIITLISLIGLICSYLNENKFWESICSSIFTGMITSLILALLSACKDRNKTDLSFIKNAYESVYDLNREFIKDDKYLEHIENYDELFESVYSKLSRLTFINQYIEKYTNEKLKKKELADKFLKEFNYSVIRKEIEYQELHDNFQKDMYKTQRDLINLVRKYQQEILRLNLKIYSKIREIDNEIYKIDKSVI